MRGVQRSAHDVRHTGTRAGGHRAECCGGTTPPPGISSGINRVRGRRGNQVTVLSLGTTIPCINHRSSNQESPPPHQVLPCHENSAATRPFRATRKYPPKGSSSPYVLRPIRRLPRKHLGRAL